MIIGRTIADLSFSGNCPDERLKLTIRVVKESKAGSMLTTMEDGIGSLEHVALDELLMTFSTSSLVGD